MYIYFMYNGVIMTLLWIGIFVVSLGVLVKGADWLLESSEKIGLRLGLSSFVVGVLIVGLGTSLPELISGIAALIKGVPDIVVSNAIGSNIANILLVIGLAAVVSRRLVVSKNLIDSELPMLAISTVIFLLVVSDGMVTIGESLFLIAAYLIYLFYTIYGGEGDESHNKFSFERPDKIVISDIVKLVVGTAGLVVGAKYLIDSVVQLSEIFQIAPGIISISAIAFGTSLPEIIVSLKAAKAGKPEIAVGNIFGSNAFNALMVVGIPGLFITLPVDPITLAVGLPVMALATLLFVISGISKTIYGWEGMMFLMLYGLFTLKLFGIL